MFQWRVGWLGAKIKTSDEGVETYQDGDWDFCCGALGQVT